MWIGGVRVIIFDEENRILLVKQHHEDRDIWMTPGGGIEDGESAAEAAVREVREETGLDIQVLRMIWHVEEVSERGQRFVNFFTARVTGGKLALGEDPEFDDAHQVLREVRFMSYDEVQNIEHLYPEYLRDELWEMTADGSMQYDAFKLR